MDDLPSCACGCGRPVKLATRTLGRLGHVKGQPQKYLCGHMGGAKARDDEQFVANFWTNVTIGSPDECWPWTSGRNKSGYGKAWREGRTLGAHRIAYELSGGVIPPGQLVRHACDNPPCCNPAHLSAGTGADNSADAVARGRTVAGEKNVRARLTGRQVRAIRGALDGGASQVVLAKEYGVANGTIYWIAIGKTWRSVLDVSS